MARFRKRPVVIEAVKVSEALAHFDSGTAQDGWPSWLSEASQAGILSIGNHSFMIKTLEGEMVADRGDWIIQGVKGELYPCKPDIFTATYEAVDDRKVA